ncbi:MAG: MarR family transcriptional regulator [Bacteroidetes bacterium]|nr:MAG: MarR family transcriptional regulator [Bacteroidota bacterium]
MKLEEAIQQTHFRSEYQKATINLIYTHNWLKDQIKSILKDYNVTMQQYNVLRILRGQYPRPVSTHTIRERMLDKMSDASRIVERLFRKGLVKRSTCPADKRLVDVTISQQGLELLSIMDTRAEALDNLLKNLSLKEVQQLNDLLDKIRE